MAPFSAKVGPGSVFEPSYLRKSDFARNIMFSNGFWLFLALRWGQDRPKIAPRRVQDRLGSLFFVLNFRFDFLSFGGRFWCRFGLPNGPLGARKSYANRPLGGPRLSWDRLGSLLFSSCGSGSLFCPSWGRLGALLAPFWAVLGSLGLVFELSGRHFGAFNFSLDSSFFLLSTLFPWPSGL